MSKKLFPHIPIMVPLYLHEGAQWHKHSMRRETAAAVYQTRHVLRVTVYGKSLQFFGRIFTPLDLDVKTIDIWASILKIRN